MIELHTTECPKEGSEANVINYYRTFALSSRDAMPALEIREEISDSAIHSAGLSKKWLVQPPPKKMDF